MVMVERKTIRKHLIEALGGKCSKCGSTKNLEIDHKKALFNGGKDQMDNLQLLCKKHHSEKTSEDFNKAIKPVNGRAFEIEGYEMLEKTASDGGRSSSSIYLPKKKWAGKKVAIVRLEK